MFLFTALGIAARALARNRLRTALTVLGLMIGIGAVICTVAIGEGSASVIHQQLLNLGDNFIWIENGSARVGGARTGIGGVAKLTVADAQAIAQELPEVARCSPNVDGRLQLIRGGQNWITSFRGVSPDYLTIKVWPVVSGASFSDADVESYASVAVIGRTVATQLFGDDDPIGAQIRIGSRFFTVTGVLKTRGQATNGQDQDDTVFLPYSTVMRSLKRTTTVDDIMCSASSTAMIPVAQEHITELLRARHNIADGRPDDFNIRAPDDAIRLQEQTAQTMGLTLAAIASVSLVVGGVGVLNIMLVSVAERTREIGLRMAIGARERDVRRQFLAEALLLGLAGGVAGIGLGFVGSRFMADMYGWPMVVSTQTIAIAVGFASAIAVGFGYYPASHAASLDPIASLRAE